MKTVYEMSIIVAVVLLTSIFTSTACYSFQLNPINVPNELITGSEPVKAYKVDGYILFESNSYWILTKELEDEVGSDIFVKKKSANEKTLVLNDILKNNSFSYRNVIAEYYFGIYDGLLFLDSGTGSEPRGLMVYDIEKKKKVYEGKYSSPISIDSNGKLTFWVKKGEANTKNCSQIKFWRTEGLDAAIEEKIMIDLRTFKTETTSGTRCSPRQ